jgi:hypothetical protein
MGGIMRKTVRRVVATCASSAMLAVVGSVVGTAPASAGGRPTDVAFVHAGRHVYVHADHSLTVSAKLRCVPGWVSSDLDMQINQGYNALSGFTTTNIPCDNQGHRVRFKIADTAHVMHLGAVTISSQFLVNNAESGDSAAGHEVGRAGCIMHRHHPLC